MQGKRPAPCGAGFFNGLGVGTGLPVSAANAGIKAAGIGLGRPVGGDKADICLQMRRQGGHLAQPLVTADHGSVLATGDEAIATAAACALRQGLRGTSGGDWTWPGLVTVELFPMLYTPVLSPAWLPEWGPLQRPEQIMPLPWLNNQNPMWLSWLQQAGVSCAPCENSPLRPSLGSQVNETRAAMAGEGGNAVVPVFRFELATGSLVQPFEQIIGLGQSCYLVYPEARRNRPAIRHLRQFLLAEAAAG